jgi:hypothetical protein
MIERALIFLQKTLVREVSLKALKRPLNEKG